nr:hypothetical protein [Tanacetum cinerariifolium]
ISADVTRSHGDDDRGKGKRKPNSGGKAAGRLKTCDKTRNLSLKEITNTKGPVSIQFELRDKQTVMPLGDRAAHWSRYIREVIRGVPLYYPSWLKVPKERKATLITHIGTEINAGIPQHLQKAYNNNKDAFKAQHWVIDPTTGTYNVEKIRRERPKNIMASEWDNGLEKFVNHYKPLVNSVRKIKCPCKSCRTMLWVSIKHLSDHITRHGFDLSCKTWVHHGEPTLPPSPPVIDNTRQPQMIDMTSLLNDLSYIPLNNEHNEPTQGDIGETSNEPTQATRNEFEELYASANEELYPGCDYMTRLEFMAKFTYFKVKGKLTDSIFNEMLEFFQNVFPISKGYKLPSSYYAIKKAFKMIGLGYESIQACKHDCCLFRGDDNKDLDFCPVCNMSRWKDSNAPGKKVPKKVLRYFLIIHRLQRLYKYSHTAKEMIDLELQRQTKAQFGLQGSGQAKNLRKDPKPFLKGNHEYERPQFESGGASRSGGWGDEEEGGDHQDDEDEDGDGDT